MGRLRAQGKQASWDELAEEVFTGFREWRVQHRRATLQEIEAALDARWAPVRARMLTDAALASAASDLRAVPAAERPVCPDCGGALVLAGREGRVLTTSHEQAIPLVRSATVCTAGGRRVSPLDEELGLLPQIALTPTLAERAVRLGTWLPFAVAARMLAHFVHTQVSESTLARLTKQAGAAYVAVQEAQAGRLAQGERGVEEVGPPVQQVSVDGAMVPLVHQVWVEAKTLASGTVQPPKHRPDGTVEIHTTDLSYFSRVAAWHDFSDQASIETVRRGTLTAGTVVGVVDGAIWEQDFLDEQCPDAVRILDWPHAVGYLTPVAHALYGVGTRESIAWLAAQKETLLHGDPQAVLAKLRGLQADLAMQASGGGAPPAALAVVADSLDYLDKRAAMLRYAQFRTLGYPIGSGTVESANKLLVEARLRRGHALGAWARQSAPGPAQPGLFGPLGGRLATAPRAVADRRTHRHACLPQRAARGSYALAVDARLAGGGYGASLATRSVSNSSRPRR